MFGKKKKKKERKSFPSKANKGGQKMGAQKKTRVKSLKCI